MPTPLAFFGGPWEYIIVLIVVMLLFGNRIPGMARSLGQGIVEFRKGLKGDAEPEKKQLPDDQSGGEISPPDKKD